MQQALENREAWAEEFEHVWLAHFLASGETDWKIYNKPHNQTPIGGKGIVLSEARVALVTSAGSYLAQQQAPFDAANPLGDYSIRLYPNDTPFDQLAYAHDHYDHTAVKDDPQVLVPLQHLRDLEAEGIIGSFAPTVISFMGYQPDIRRTMDETAPAVLNALQDQQATAALFVPS